MLLTRLQLHINNILNLSLTCTGDGFEATSLADKTCPGMLKQINEDCPSGTLPIRTLSIWISAQQQDVVVGQLCIIFLLDICIPVYTVFNIYFKETKA